MTEFEKNIPIWVFFAIFAVLFTISNFIRKKSREQMLVREGQLEIKNGQIPSIKQRLAGNKAWSSGEIVSKGRNLMLAVWLLVAVWFLTFGVAFVKSFSNPEIKTAGTVALGVFTFLGLGFVVFAVRLTMRYLRFGESRCYITEKAGVLGQTMTGYIRNNKEIKATGDYTVDLQCIEIYSTGTGKNRKTHNKIHWQSKQKVPHLGKNPKMGIPFTFELPKYPPETGYQISLGNVNWQISIHAPVEGVDYTAGFVVPVFKMDYSE